MVFARRSERSTDDLSIGRSDVDSTGTVEKFLAAQSFEFIPELIGLRRSGAGRNQDARSKPGGSFAGIGRARLPRACAGCQTARAFYTRTCRMPADNTAADPIAYDPDHDDVIIPVHFGTVSLRVQLLPDRPLI